MTEQTSTTPINEEEALSRREQFLSSGVGGSLWHLEMNLLELKIFGKEDEKLFGKKNKKDK